MVSRAPSDTAAPWVETWVVAALFLALGLVGIAQHEMWRDELEIWLIARDSGTLGQLFDNMGTEGHPALWYLLNFLLTRFTNDPLAMQLLNLALGTTAAALFFRHAPFTTLQRLLFCFGYFALYEFTVISRSYALGLLLAFAFCVRFRHQRRLETLGALILLLLANTNLYGTIIASHVVLLLVFQALLQRRPERLWRDRKMSLALSIVLVGVLTGLGHTWLQARAIGPAHAGAYAPEHDLAWIAGCLSTIVRGAAPIPDPTRFHFWNSSVLDLLPGSSGAFLGATLGTVLVALAAYRLRFRPALTLTFLLGSLTMLSITFFVWFGSARHHGQIFLWYLICSWLGYGLATNGAEVEEAHGVGRRRTGAVLTSILILQGLAGAHAYVMDLRHPFSNAKAVGVHLRQEEFRDLTWVGSIDYAVQPITAFVDRAFYYPESGDTGTFLDWGPGRRIVPPEFVLQEALTLLKNDERDVLIVFSYRPGTLEPGDALRLGADARLHCFARFVGALVPDENYHLCRAFETRRNPGPADVDSPNGRADNDDRDAQQNR